ncbi:PREDICTED: AAA-ATPase At1g43910-like [Tarenaya hassleriana]|uniref:AAA-ATPase At1g43910-like n=1 Tax=Tarenaya hassleriana TaxID=28532 RepID=UPI00053C8BF7|nr:PREDICTED: AAA-ATPase At1g43910-like [Tarenaya hassleriana]
MASLYNQIPSVSAIFSLYTSFSAIMMILRTILNEIVPNPIREYIAAKLSEVFASYFQSYFTFVIEQRWEFFENQTFRAAEVYLPTRLAGLSTGKLLVGSSNLNNLAASPMLGIPVDTKILDEFDGIPLEWTLHSVETRKNLPEKRYFHLTCKKEFREKIEREYFPYFAKQAKEIMSGREKLKIYTYSQERSTWEAAIFEHHTTFETLAIEPDLKTALLEDLDAFSRGEDFFKSVGRSWKRGYLLYGPPGTGKSSLVAAIANHMKYHIYDLQIQSVRDDAELREILTLTKNRSILLIEDIDCSTHISRKRESMSFDEEDGENWWRTHNKKHFDIGVSLSGLLNFVDGLWSSCGEERIIIFTTNHKEKLDPALLRPGRMDVHILMSYCTPFVFKKLATLYLKIDGHDLFEPIGKLLEEVNTTPAEVTQQLMASKEPELVLRGLVEFLAAKKTEKEDDNREVEIEEYDENKEALGGAIALVREDL